MQWPLVHSNLAWDWNKMDYSQQGSKTLREVVAHKVKDLPVSITITI